jgi:hypothetical protein
VNERVATGPSAWAKKLLERQGWTEGKGLGKAEDGVTTHVRVKKKEDTAALGYVAPPGGDAAAQDWWSVDPFAAAAAAAGVKSGRKSKATKSGRSSGGGGDGAGSGSGSGAAAVPGVPAGSDVQDFYAGLFAATGGARLGMRARRDQPGKVARSGDDAAGAAALEEPKSSDDEASVDSAVARKRRKERKRLRREAELALAAAGDADAEARILQRAAKRAQR